MTDYFALLGLPRRPWIEADALQQAFLRHSAEAHPDRMAGADAAAKRQAHERHTLLNAAHACLRETRTRLRHWLELETGTRPADLQEMPEPLATVFFDVSRVCREADQVLDRKRRTSSPLLQVALFEAVQGVEERLARQALTLEEQLGRLEQELKDLSASLPTPANEGGTQAAPSHVVARLHAVYRALSFQDRWLRQIRERLIQLRL
jgi:DnaJ-domain-containing protein 1